MFGSDKDLDSLSLSLLCGKCGVEEKDIPIQRGSKWDSQKEVWSHLASFPKVLQENLD